MQGTEEVIWRTRTPLLLSSSFYATTKAWIKADEELAAKVVVPTVIFKCSGPLPSLGQLRVEHYTSHPSLLPRHCPRYQRAYWNAFSLSLMPYAYVTRRHVAFYDGTAWFGVINHSVRLERRWWWRHGEGGRLLF